MTFTQVVKTLVLLRQPRTVLRDYTNPDNKPTTNIDSQGFIPFTV